jgi:hypothetical protein
MRPARRLRLATASVRHAGKSEQFALDQMSDAAAHMVVILSRRNVAQEPLVQNWALPAP